MPKTTPTADTTSRHTAEVEGEEIRDLILWCRSERIVVSEVQVGLTRLVMQDLHLAGTIAPKKLSDEELRQNLYKEFGGEALEQMTAETDEGAPGDEEYDGAEEE